MTESNKESGGGIHISKARRNVNLIRKNIISGNITENTTTTIIIQKGFKSEEQKHEFQMPIDRLRRLFGLP